jgi:hypothetical protein
VQARVQPEPVRVSTVQELPSLHDVGQFPSQISPGSTTPFPQTPTQLLSIVALHPDGQQPSPFVQAVIAANVQARVHIEPTRVSAVQAFPSLQEAGQFPSHVSPGSIIPLPHAAEQLPSLLALQPGGQQPSPPTQLVIGALAHWTLQVIADPVSVSRVHELPSLQEVGQFPSQRSGGSTIPFPQDRGQSSSVVGLQPDGQQPSPLRHAVMVV